jgi:hypothetical protein
MSQMGVYSVGCLRQALSKGYCFFVSFTTSSPTVSNGKSTALLV